MVEYLKSLIIVSRERSSLTIVKNALQCDTFVQGKADIVTVSQTSRVGRICSFLGSWCEYLSDATFTCNEATEVYETVEYFWLVTEGESNNRILPVLEKHSANRDYEAHTVNEAIKSAYYWKSINLFCEISRTPSSARPNEVFWRILPMAKLKWNIALGQYCYNSLTNAESCES